MNKRQKKKNELKHIFPNCSRKNAIRNAYKIGFSGYHNTKLTFRFIFNNKPSLKNIRRVYRNEVKHNMNKIWFYVNEMYNIDMDFVKLYGGR